MLLSPGHKERKGCTGVKAAQHQKYPASYASLRGNENALNLAEVFGLKTSQALQVPGDLARVSMNRQMMDQVAVSIIFQLDG
jgi:hypothetical protein